MCEPWPPRMYPVAPPEQINFKCPTEFIDSKGTMKVRVPCNTWQQQCLVVYSFSFSIYQFVKTSKQTLASFPGSSKFFNATCSIEKLGGAWGRG